jgi:hypothetical protein
MCRIEPSNLLYERNVAFPLSLQEKLVRLAAEVLDNVHIQEHFIASASIVKHKKDASLAMQHLWRRLFFVVCTLTVMVMVARVCSVRSACTGKTICCSALTRDFTLVVASISSIDD